MKSVMYLLDVKSLFGSVGRLRYIGAGLVMAMLFALEASAQVVINEIATSNETTVENEGKFPDWVELYNNSLATENLFGMSLTYTNSNASTTNRFIFTDNVLLDPQKFLVIWFDNETNAPGIHALYNLPKTEGGGLVLARPDLSVDVVKFGLQITDLTIGRIPDGTGGFQLNVPTPALANQAQPVGTQLSLKFNEWMATNSAGDDKDWIELYNSDLLPVPLGGLVFSDETGVPGEKPMITQSYIAGGGFIRLWCDGSPKKGADHLDFSLSSSSGEAAVSIFLPDLVTYIERISFGPQQRNLAEGRLPDGSDNIVRPFAAGKDTPGASNFQPITNVVISEVLTHTDYPLEDAIELHNPTAEEVDISDWWLSNSKNDAKKFRIPPDTRIPAGGFKVFYEMTNGTGGFNTSGTGNSPDFTMNSARGDELYLLTGDAAGNLTGYRRSIDFGSAANGVSFGRYITSTGGADMTAMSSRTFGQDNPISIFQFRMGTGKSNAYPLVGPLVINEIMYKPPNISVTNDNSIDEYVELHNITSTNVPLYWIDATNKPGVGTIVLTNGWKLDDAVKFTFPGTLTLSPNGFILVVNFDPATNTTQLAAFRNRFNIPGSFTNIFGPYGNKLKNSGASVKLYKPDPVQQPPHPDAGFVPYVLVDRVNYSDNPPWPSTADGLGSSLQRRHRAEYGNDPINWGGLAPTPGRTNAFTGLVSVTSISRLASLIDILFTAQEGQPYTVEFQDALVPGGAWTLVTNITMTATEPVHCYDNTGSPTASRFYRIKTPAVP